MSVSRDDPSACALKRWQTVRLRWAELDLRFVRAGGAETLMPFRLYHAWGV
jgi:hypothetical protein